MTHGNTPEFEPTWESLKNYSVPQWYMDAKFGIFIHWGVYSVPAFASEWYPRNMYIQGSPEFEHHVKTYGSQSKFGYKDFIPQFKAEKFDAERWVQLFKDAGAKYVVPVAEHHDGFAMYDCSFSDWTAVKMGPKRDIVGELAAATRKQGLVFGVSSHRAEHWWFFDGGRKFDSDVQDPQYDGLYGPAQMASPVSHSDAWRSQDWTPRPDAKFLEDWLARTCELVDKYQPQLLYFDWWIEQVVFELYLQRFAAYYYKRAAEWQKGVAINHKSDAFPEGVAVFAIERGQLKDIRPLFWQTDTAISKNSWGYVKEQDYKTAGDIIGDLVDIVSKNGSLLLNVGPRPDGIIPEPKEPVEEKPTGPAPEAVSLPSLDNIEITMLEPSDSWMPPVPKSGGGGPSYWTPPGPSDEEWERAVGRRGEEIIYRQELIRVRNLGYQESRVVWVADQNPNADFDILSVDDDGEDIWIEVKSTTGRDGRFRWPKAEFEKAIEKRNRYILLRVYEANTERPSIKPFRDPVGILLRKGMRLDINTFNAVVEPINT